MPDQLLTDLRYALRRMARQPGLTAAVVVSLALGVGAVAAVFSVADAVLLRPLPVAEPHRLLSPGSEIFSYPAYLDYRERNRTFDGLAAYDSMGRRLLLERDDTVEVVPGVLVSGDYFEVFGVRMALGRGFTAAEDEGEGAPVAVIGHDLWRRGFGGDPGVLGRRIRVNGTPVTIVGVAPAGFRGERLNNPNDVWMPLALHRQVTPRSGAAEMMRSRDSQWIRFAGRLREGVTVEQARDDLRSIAAQLRDEHPRYEAGEIEELYAASTVAALSRRDEIRSFMGLLVGMIGAALLVACTNVATLLLARGERRRQEIGLRMALGASGGRLARLLLTESLVLALSGGLLGLLVAKWTIDLLSAFELPGQIAVSSLRLGVDARVLGSCMAVSLLTGLAFGCAPAWRATRRGSAPSLRLRSAAAAGSAGGGPLLRGAFAVVQVALCLVLLVCSGLFLRSLRAALDTDVGFDGEPLAIVTVDPSLAGYGPGRARQFYEDAVEAVEALPSVAAASWALAAPVETRSYMDDAMLEGHEGEPGSFHINFVGPGFFRALGIPLVRGGGFGPTPGVAQAIVNRTLAERYWPGDDPIGKRLRTPGIDSIEVVGLAADATYRRLGEAPMPYLYLPLWLGSEMIQGRMRLIARSEGDAAALLAPMRERLRSVDPRVPIVDAATWRQHVGAQLQPQQMGASLLGAFGLIAVVLAAVGVYGVVSFGVDRRLREFGIRIALGARREEVLRLALRAGVATTLVGLLIGLAAAMAASRLIAGFLFGIAALDPLTFGLTAALLFAVAMAASWLPARRATRVDPALTLRVD